MTEVAATREVPSPSPSSAAAEPATVKVPTVLNKLKKWGDYGSFGTSIEVDDVKLLPMKTPLTERILRDWNYEDPPKHVHTVGGFLAAQSSEGRRVGLIVDLCNHECLYQDEIPAEVRYEHIWCVAKEVPDDKDIQNFASVVDSFVERNRGLYVAVHCSYGFNRTGFMICSYLINNRGVTIEDAVRWFAESRAPGIKHEKFLVELRNRYGHLPQNQNLAAGSGSGGGKGAGALPSLASASAEERRQMEESLMSLDVESGKDLLAKLEEYKDQKAAGSPTGKQAAALQGQKDGRVHPQGKEGQGGGGGSTKEAERGARDGLDRKKQRCAIM